MDYHAKLQKNHALLNRVTNATTEEEQSKLEEISKKSKISATLLPIRSVGVQGMWTGYPDIFFFSIESSINSNELLFWKLGDARSYSYVLGLSSDTDPDWNDLLFLAKLIPRILHNINRVCFVFGSAVGYQINDITDTKISRYTLAQLRQADHVANTVKIHSSICFSSFCTLENNVGTNELLMFYVFLCQQILAQSGFMRSISQMPVVLIPVHFDRDPVNRIPSCGRSIVLRPFDTNDFMTGVPVVPGSPKLPLAVSHVFMFTIFGILIELRSNEWLIWIYFSFLFRLLLKWFGPYRSSMVLHVSFMI